MKVCSLVTLSTSLSSHIKSGADDDEKKGSGWNFACGERLVRRRKKLQEQVVEAH